MVRCASNEKMSEKSLQLKLIERFRPNANKFDIKIQAKPIGNF